MASESTDDSSLVSDDGSSIDGGSLTSVNVEGENSKRKKKKEKSPFNDPEWVSEHIGSLDDDTLKHLKSAEFRNRIIEKGSKAIKYEFNQKEYEDKLRDVDKGLYVGDLAEAEHEEKKGILLVRVSFLANIVLTAGKGVALALSGSVAVLASFLDSCLDLLSGSFMYLASRLQKTSKKEHYKYPVGKRRLETLSVIVFASAMFTATTQVLIEAIQSLIDISNSHLDVGVTTIIILTCTIVAKFVLFLVCRSHESPLVQALAQDHRNDVISNTFGMATALIGYYLWKYTDPIGGLCIACFLMVNWARTGYEQVKRMTGLSAPPEFVSLITYITATHDKRVLAIDTVRAYYTSNNFIVEVDILLPEKMKLREAHDIGEKLQIKLEQLPQVERAFVHLDYESHHSHFDEHPSLAPMQKAQET